MNPIFKIQNLTCSYCAGQPVLVIDQLSIPKGKLVFLLGISGVGKSTFIETLGLMNKTIVQTPATQLKFFPKTEGIELKTFWNQSNKELAYFRSQYFSFIFQNTNLMPNFTAGENMCISQLIAGKTLAAAKLKVLKVMKELNLPADVFDKKITQLSGGQRQRLAFVRAITADFKVLFGDEPTGNLDKQTASILMEMLKNNLHKREQTGIIVSHDIDLAIRYADQIILLTPQKTGNHGVIDAHHTLNRVGENFQTTTEGKAVDAKRFIYKKLNIKNTAAIYA